MVVSIHRLDYFLPSIESQLRRMIVAAVNKIQRTHFAATAYTSTRRVTKQLQHSEKAVVGAESKLGFYHKARSLLFYKYYIIHQATR